MPDDVISRNVAALVDTAKGQQGRSSKSLTVDQAADQATRTAGSARNTGRVPSNRGTYLSAAPCPEGHRRVLAVVCPPPNANAP